MESQLEKLLEDTWAKARNVGIAHPRMNAKDFRKRQDALEEYMNDAKKELKKIVERV